MTPAVTIVIIEDHAIVRGLVARVATDAFQSPVVHAVREGRAGVELCRRERPDLVLLDLELPDADGFELVAEIRAVSPAARIVILSAHTEAYALHRVHAAHVEGFIDKNEQTPEVTARLGRSPGSLGGAPVHIALGDSPRCGFPRQLLELSDSRLESSKRSRAINALDRLNEGGGHHTRGGPFSPRGAKYRANSLHE